MTGNYMEFREIVKKYEFDKMFEDDSALQVYRDNANIHIMID